MNYKIRAKKPRIEPTATTDAVATSTESQVKPISERKRAANRKNAQKSTGPKTKAGKRWSRGNAIKHGFFVQEMPLKRYPFYEDSDILGRIFQELVNHFQPVGPLEQIHVEMIAACCWKMRRLQIAETATIKVATLREETAIRYTPFRKSRSVAIGSAFIKANEKARESGYVDDALVKTILEFMSDVELRTNFVVANQKVRDLSTQRDADSSSNAPRKKAQSALFCSLRALQKDCDTWEEALAVSAHQDQEPHYAQNLLPSSDMLDSLLRYQSVVDRRLYRTIAELERLQRQRLGDAGTDGSNVIVRTGIRLPVKLQAENSRS